MQLDTWNRSSCFKLKAVLLEVLKQRNSEIIDCGTYDADCVEDPVYGQFINLYTLNYIS